MVHTPHLTPTKDFEAYSYALLKLYTHWRDEKEICTIDGEEHPASKVLIHELTQSRQNKDTRLKIDVARVDFQTDFADLLEKMKLHSKYIVYGAPENSRVDVNVPRADGDAGPEEVDSEDDPAVFPVATDGVVPRWPEKEYNSRVERLHPQQRAVVDIVGLHARSDKDKTDPLFLIVTGPGGTGLLYIYICHARACLRILNITVQ